MKLFYVNSAKNIRKTYEDLYNDIVNKQVYKTYLYEKDIYSYLVELLGSILLEKPIVILDADFSKEEVLRLGIKGTDLQLHSDVDAFDMSYQDFLKKLQKSDLGAKITLYTSGTTGLPKKVTHTLESLKRNVKIGERFNSNVWGLAFNPTHIAGLQVIFQAISNLNPIIDLFNQNKKVIVKIFNEERITNISATSTFYKMLLPNICEPVLSAKNITFGGEKIDDTIIEELVSKFPFAKIRNIYASTETGSLFTSKRDTFIIPEEWVSKISFTDESELLIHQSLLGHLENDHQIKDSWYYTGDIVQKKDDFSFVIVSRKSDIVNVGGYNVNPHEVEHALNKLFFVRDAVVKSRKNSITGNIIVADVIIDDSYESKVAIKEIKDELSKVLQVWKIPRIIKVVDNIEQSRAGKKVRK